MLIWGGTRALAADEPQTGSITIENAIEGATYNFYRIFDMKMTDPSDASKGVSYEMTEEQYANYRHFPTLSNQNSMEYQISSTETSISACIKDLDWMDDHPGQIPERWDNEFNEDQYEECYDYIQQYIQECQNKLSNLEKAYEAPITSSHGNYYWTLEVEEDMKDRNIDKIFSFLGTEFVDYTATEANGTVVLDDLPFGLYVIIPSGFYLFDHSDGSETIPVNIILVDSDETIKSKGTSSAYKVEKKANKTNVSVGEIVRFKISSTMPVEGNYNNLWLGDTLEGLKLTGDWKLTFSDVQVVNSSDVDLSVFSDYLNNIKSDYQNPDFRKIYSSDNIDQITNYMTQTNFPAPGASSFMLPISLLYDLGVEAKSLNTVDESIIIDESGFNSSSSRESVPYVLEYSAIVSNEANKGNIGNVNNCMNIIFDYNIDSFTIYDFSDQEIVYTYDMNLLKYADGDTSDVLSGAQFALYKQGEDGKRLYYKLTEDATLVEGKDLTGPKVTWVDIGDKTINQAIADGDITAVTSDQDGKTAFTGIPHDTYYLQEVKAPEGYNLMAEDMLVELGADAPADFEVQVENTGGALLPETGGPGTALFTMMGLLLMAGAAAIYLSHRKQQQ